MPRVSALPMMSLLGLLLAASVMMPVARAQAPTPNAATVAAALSEDIHATVVAFAAQRDAGQSWPANITAQMRTLEMCDTALSNLRSGSNLTAIRARFRACMRTAQRISRWLAANLESAAVATPTRAQFVAVAARMSERLALVKDVANRAGASIDSAPADAARMQVQRAQESGTDAQLRAALRTFRDAIEALHEALPEPTN